MENWILKSDRFNIKGNKKRESLWTQGNGYMGIRAVFEERYVGDKRTTLINGIFNAPVDETPEIVALPDATGCEIEINGESFSMLYGRCENYNACLDMKSGEFKRSLKWTSPRGDSVLLEFSRFVSDTKKHIFAQRIAITPLSGDVEIKMVTGIDGKVTNSGVQHCSDPRKSVYKDEIVGLYTRTVQSGVEIAVHYGLKYSNKKNSWVDTDRRGIYTHLVFNAQQGNRICVEKFISYTSSRDFEYNPSYGTAEQVAEAGKAYLAEAIDMGFDKLFEESKASWHKYWKENKITVECRDDFIGKAVIFAQYHLYIMASGEDNRLGIGAKAMSGEGYKGHSYWDTELFLLPYYIYNAPKIARNLLEYRYKLLDDSMKKAKELGYIGAMYPWESAWIDDGDAADKYCGVDTVTGMVKRLWFSEKEIHVTAAVAYGVWHYYMATHDDDFMERCGFEIVVLTALFWTSRVEKVNGRYEILDVIGPDEYKGNVNNNAYTNYMAMHNMRYAGQILKNCPEALYAKLNKEYGVEEIKRRIYDVVGNIYLPKAEDDGIISQFDGCKNLIEIDLSPYKNINKVATIFADFGNDEIYARQMYKQADLVMLFYLMRDMFTDEEIRKNYVYYEKRTLHDSSLSMCIHSIVAARYGMDDIADDMFYKACCVDLGDNTDNSDEGIHAASLGGIWLMIAQGYGGLEVNEKGLFVDPILPNGWSEYSFCIYYKGTRLKITVNGSGCIIKRLSGDEVSIFLNGEEKTV